MKYSKLAGGSKVAPPCVDVCLIHSPPANACCLLEFMFSKFRYVNDLPPRNREQLENSLI